MHVTKNKKRLYQDSGIKSEEWISNQAKCQIKGSLASCVGPMIVAGSASHEAKFRFLSVKADWQAVDGGPSTG